MGENQARENLISVSKEHIPATLMNIFVALLIWLFGELVFLPAAYQISSRGTPLVVSMIILIGFTIFVIHAFNSGLLLLLDSLSNVLSYEYKNWRKSRLTIDKLQKVTKNIVYTIVVLTFYLLYSPFLVVIYPALNGLVLIPVILWISWTLFKTVNVLLLD